MEYQWAIIFRPWEDEPVYHANAYGEGKPYMTTICGRSFGMHLPQLPMKHVVKFARPCKGCFPS